MTRMHELMETVRAASILALGVSKKLVVQRRHWPGQSRGMRSAGLGKDGWFADHSNFSSLQDPCVSIASSFPFFFSFFFFFFTPIPFFNPILS
jgi:hypothetical protein